jgi:hypothetical protein
MYFSDRWVPRLRAGIDVDGFFNFRAGVRGSLGAAGPGIFNKFLSGIGSFRGRCWFLYLYRRSRNSCRKFLVIYTPFDIVYSLFTWYTEKAGGRSSKK